MNTQTLNVMCENYLSLSEQINLLEKQKESIKKTLMKYGPTETNRFTVDIKQVERNSVVDANTLLVALGPVVVTENNLIKTSSYDKLTVKEK